MNGKIVWLRDLSFFVGEGDGSKVGGSTKII